MKRAVLIVAMLLWPVTAGAMEWRLRYDPKGKMHLALRQSGGTATLLVTVNALTGDNSPGPCLLRLDGVPIDRVDGPPYYFRADFQMGSEIFPFEDARSQAKCRPIVLTEEWFQREHSFEAYFQAQDNRGRTKKDRSDAPAQQFILGYDPGVAAATAPQAFDRGQLDAAVKQGFEQGRTATEEAWAKEREDLLSRLNQLSGQLAKATAEDLAERAKQKALAQSRPVKLPEARVPIAEPPKVRSPEPELEVRILRCRQEDLDDQGLAVATATLRRQDPLSSNRGEIEFAEALLFSVNSKTPFSIGLEGEPSFSSRSKDSRQVGGLKILWGEDDREKILIIKTATGERRIALKRRG